MLITITITIMVVIMVVIIIIITIRQRQQQRQGWAPDLTKAARVNWCSASSSFCTAPISPRASVPAVAHGSGQDQVEDGEKAPTARSFSRPITPSTVSRVDVALVQN